MADFPYGTPVIYEDLDGREAPLALIAIKEAGAKADLAVMDRDGGWELIFDVSRSAAGGRHTWRSLVEKAD
jgi:hypothetical protein